MIRGNYEQGIEKVQQKRMKVGNDLRKLTCIRGMTGANRGTQNSKREPSDTDLNVLPRLSFGTVKAGW